MLLCSRVSASSFLLRPAAADVLATRLGLIRCVFSKCDASACFAVMGADLIIAVEGPGAKGSSLAAPAAGNAGTTGGIEAGRVAARAGKVVGLVG